MYRDVCLEHSEGWNHITYPIIDFVLDNGGTVDQVKEKFGELRVYANMPTPELREEFYSRLRIAEELSLKTCEYCGKPGEIRSGGWIKTLCDEHSK